ncbi:unnamed protein product [Lactuca saligna]|uniref:TIR domain-containing protein n=1 Tax=Lactuca saligna TaxID=75948 RepID=A0AA35YDP0_LACSI|nr:unnamed protein product [Lactuca saligna]
MRIHSRSCDIQILIWKDCVLPNSRGTSCSFCNFCHGRSSYTYHLHKALVDANITTFLDDEEIATGEDFKPELESAIKASRASVIILSKNFATSTWCLDELVLILEQRMTCNHIVIPTFYHVQPTHVRKKHSIFGDAMANYKQMMEAEKMQIKEVNML